ncbi:hypothetical protein K402DRAFT_343168, partial [Aulographum hederae CBS 113979]
QKEASFFRSLGAKRVRVTSGPYEAPPNNQASGMAMFLERNSKVPCNDCLITWMQAGLTLENGSYANAQQGLWLHHGVQLETGSTDVVCPNGYENLPINWNRFFASGNERSATNLCLNGTSKTGYYLSPTSQIWTMLEVMNQTPHPMKGMLTIDYEYLPGPSFPPGFQKLKSVWLDVAGCGNSEVPAVRNASTFDLRSPTPWTVPKEWPAGRAVITAGHLHDGGTRLQLQRNGESVCDSTATYGGDPGYVDGTAMPGMDGMKMEHISHMQTCDVPTVKAGDVFEVQAFYNFTGRPGMVNDDGTLSPVMGIGMMYFAEGDGEVQKVEGGQREGMPVVGNEAKEGMERGSENQWRRGLEWRA